MPIIDYGSAHHGVTFPGLPDWIVEEVADICVGFGFIAGRTIRFDDDITPEEQQSITTILQEIAPHEALTTEQALEVMSGFFLELEHLFGGHEIPQEKPLFGLFRISSPYDIDVVGMGWDLAKFLNFLLVNIGEEVRWYGKYFFEEICGNSGLTLEYDDTKNRLHFTHSSSVVCHKTVKIRQHHHPVICRMVPGFSLPGLYFLLSIGTHKGQKNIYTQVGVRFERKDEEIVPVIHNIQTPKYSLAIHHGALITTSVITEDMKYPRDIISQKSVFDFVSAIATFLTTLGYPKVQIVDGRESLWLKYHQNARIHAMDKSVAMYHEASMYVTGKHPYNGRTTATFSDMLLEEAHHLHKGPFEEDCLLALYTILHRFDHDFSPLIDVRVLSRRQSIQLLEHVGTMRAALLEAREK